MDKQTKKKQANKATKIFSYSLNFTNSLNTLKAQALSQEQVFNTLRLIFLFIEHFVVIYSSTFFKILFEAPVSKVSHWTFCILFKGAVYRFYMHGGPRNRRSRIRFTLNTFNFFDPFGYYGRFNGVTDRNACKCAIGPILATIKETVAATGMKK